MKERKKDPRNPNRKTEEEQNPKGETPRGEKQEFPGKTDKMPPREPDPTLPTDIDEDDEDVDRRRSA